MIKASKFITDFRATLKGGEAVNYPVLRVAAGKYKIVTAAGEVVGYIEDRRDDWYGEICINGEQFYNHCDDSLTAVVDNFSGTIAYRVNYVKGRGKEDSIKSCERLKLELARKFGL